MQDEAYRSFDRRMSVDEAMGLTNRSLSPYSEFQTDADNDRVEYLDYIDNSTEVIDLDLAFAAPDTVAARIAERREHATRPPTAPVNNAGRRVDAVDVLTGASPFAGRDGVGNFGAPLERQFALSPPRPRLPRRLSARLMELGRIVTKSVSNFIGRKDSVLADEECQRREFHSHHPAMRPLPLGCSS